MGIAGEGNNREGFICLLFYPQAGISTPLFAADCIGGASAGKGFTCHDHPLPLYHELLPRFAVDWIYVWVKGTFADTPV